MEMMTREQARAALGLSLDARVVYLSAGGGGDVNAERQIEWGLEALLGIAPEVEIVVGAGPLYRGKVRRNPRVTWLVNESSAELAHAFDVAVTAAGYNSFVELMHAGVPSVFIPQQKIADDQRLRAERSVVKGAARLVDSSDEPAVLARAVLDLLEPRERERASLAARALVPRNAARTAAAELLRLVLSVTEVDRAEAAIGDAAIASSIELGFELSALIELMHEIDGEAGLHTSVRELGRLGKSATDIVRRAIELGVPAREIPELARAVLRRSTATDMASREALVLEAVLRIATPERPALEEPRQ
jgi:hypothetical protein